MVLRSLRYSLCGILLIASLFPKAQHTNAWAKASIWFHSSDRSEWESEQLFRIQNRVDEVMPSTRQLLGWRISYRWKSGPNSQWIISPLCWMETYRSGGQDVRSSVLRHEWRSSLGWRGNFIRNEKWKLGARLLQEFRMFSDRNDLGYRSRFRPEVMYQMNARNQMTGYAEGFYVFGKSQERFIEQWRFGIMIAHQFNKHWFAELGFVHAPRQVAHEWGGWTDENFLLGINYHLYSRAE